LVVMACNASVDEVRATNVALTPQAALAKKRIQFFQENQELLLRLSEQMSIYIRNSIHEAF